MVALGIAFAVGLLISNLIWLRYHERAINALARERATMLRVAENERAQLISQVQHPELIRLGEQEVADEELLTAPYNPELGLVGTVQPESPSENGDG